MTHLYAATEWALRALLRATEWTLTHTPRRW